MWFLIFYAAILTTNYFFGEKPETQRKNSTISVSPIRKNVVIGNFPKWKVENGSGTAIRFFSPCEKPGTMRVFRVANERKIEVSKFDGCSVEHFPSFAMEPGESRVFDFREPSGEIFSEAGRYFLEMDFESDESLTVAKSQEIKVEDAGALRQLFRAIVSKPLFNLLVFFTEKLPGHSFGWAIVMLTVVVRVALFLPNQRAMRSQRELQKLQPKLEELKKKHGKNQQMMAMKTMELYRTHKINPMSSCLPILLQMPFLLGVYFLVRDGMSPHLRYLLYEFQWDFDFSIAEFDFLWWQVDKKDILLLPILVGVAQFLAVKLSLISQKKRNAEKPKKTDGIAGQMAQMQKMMLYFLPVMIAFFTASFPAGVGIYWLTSTIFGIFQQKLVNWQLDQPVVRRKE